MSEEPPIIVTREGATRLWPLAPSPMTITVEFFENYSGTITEFVPNERVVYESEGKAGLIRHSFALAASGDGVEVTKTFDPVKTKMPFTIFAPLAQLFSVPGSLKGDLERIKGRVEAG
ncbi:MAG: hypothetical protein IIC89_07855 [Chloroflexi bacterium]|nr:hypothetical protein [Chloroflexota bacterium]